MKKEGDARVGALKMQSNKGICVSLEGLLGPKERLERAWMFQTKERIGWDAFPSLLSGQPSRMGRQRIGAFHRKTPDIRAR